MNPFHEKNPSETLPPSLLHFPTHPAVTIISLRALFENCFQTNIFHLFTESQNPPARSLPRTVKVTDTGVKRWQEVRFFFFFLNQTPDRWTPLDLLMSAVWGKEVMFVMLPAELLCGKIQWKNTKISVPKYLVSKRCKPCWQELNVAQSQYSIFWGEFWDQQLWKMLIMFIRVN